ncbi:SAM-dependent methyltransferase [Nonomuraea sp. CA-218870]|uniref:SAM-dependent methyltransferase n=1 Tax=Nonomuraea corallina TaxID=2989783 RepID=A0ABT4SAX6_9ACTN|nr:SAM-dependent methyltransferase [Nonomuraea corallina]MDA0634364.1 SAM-dependent methyltransferase [Nonomuraea corallina]
MSLPDHAPTPGVEPLSQQSTPARLYGALGEGKDHFQVDEDNAAALDEILPGMARIVPDNRSCLRRMVAAAADLGISQFVDLGSGLPDQPPNLHEVVHDRQPGASFVYVDRDPVVCTHGRALLRAPRVTMVEADVRDLDDVFSRPEVRMRVDFGLPVCLVLGAVLHFLADDEVRGVMEASHDWLPQGSLLLVTHATSDQPHYTPEQVEAARDFYQAQTGERLYLRRVQEIADLVLPGCAPMWPGLVSTAFWRAGPEAGPDARAPYFVAVAAEVRGLVEDRRAVQESAG